MKWSKRSAQSIQSGPYIICRVWLFGELGFCVFCGEEWVGFHDSKEKARAAAADHSEGNR